MQILFIAPHFFVYKYESGLSEKDFDFIVDIPSDIESRIKVKHNF